MTEHPYNRTLDMLRIPAVQNTLGQQRQQIRRSSVWRSRNGPPSELIVP
jgi:hypothetical protein